MSSKRGHQREYRETLCTCSASRGAPGGANACASGGANAGTSGGTTRDQAGSEETGRERGFAGQACTDDTASHERFSYDATAAKAYGAEQGWLVSAREARKPAQPHDAA